MSFILVTSFFAGILAALSPCVLPILPMMAGSAMSKSKSGPLFLALGMIFSFSSVGIIFSQTTKFFELEENTVQSISAWLLILFGTMLIMPKLKETFSLRTSSFANFASKVSRSLDSGSSYQQFGIGLLMGAIWSPCVGPTLGIALGLAGSTEGNLQALSMMFSFGIGLSIPLLAVSYGLKKFMLQRRASLMVIGKMGNSILGVSMIIFGILMISGIDKNIQSFLNSNLPEWFLAIST
ncbi:MAG: cytochrome c biogenesis CcdA family protein, partial [Pseudobdellovibrionaceae bacterium]